MTKKERVLRTIDFQETDHVPLYDFLDSNSIREYFGGETITPENAWTLEYKAIRSFLDATRGIMIPTFTPYRTTDEDGFVTFHDIETSWIEKRPFDDLEGLVAFAKKDIERCTAWNPDATYIENYRRDIQTHRKGLGDDTVIIIESDVGLEDIRDKCGIELFCYLEADYPEILSEWLRVKNEKEVRRAKAIADADIVPIMLVYTDLAYKTGLIHPPAWLRKHFIPALKNLTNTYHDAGVKCLFHSDGNLWEILDDLSEAGIDGINPIETCAGMSIVEVRKKYPKLFIAGGIDVSHLLTFGTADEVHETCIQAVRDTHGMGYLMGSTTELLPTVKVENLLAMIDVAKHSQTYA
ncbi:MAG TPA: uroporphyrinogen decarboxylase family protein [Spirochaetia bacterium]|jgi:uroporphyrinogen-III decarboxylase|nr:uroporphyrinogen decarboxylase family protein [Spirochaetia bacterium]